MLAFLLDYNYQSTNKIRKRLYTLLKKFMTNAFLQFVMVGALNTVITYLIYITLLLYVPYMFAYSISYLVGIFIAYFLNTTIVFKTQTNLKSFFQFPLVYVVQYLINIYFLQLLIEHFGMNDKLAPIVTIIISIPITFILSKFVLTGRQH